MCYSLPEVRIRVNLPIVFRFNRATNFPICFRLEIAILYKIKYNIKNKYYTILLEEIISLKMYAKRRSKISFKIYF